MRLKVCGITDIQQLQVLETMQVEMAGFIFYPASPRYILLNPDANQIGLLSLNIKKVGVFVNADYDEIMYQADQFKLDYIQLHGEESPDLAFRLSKAIKTIKAFRVSESADLKNVADYEDAADLFLFDTKANLQGGTGKKFDWSILHDAQIQKPFFLSGGIGMTDLNALRDFSRHPRAIHFDGVDVNSRFETTPGIKDLAQLNIFIEQFRSIHKS